MAVGSTRNPKTTLATVAASAGVSVATVSKVVNGRHDVAPATRAKVADLLARHDYVGRSGQPPGAPTRSRTSVLARYASPPLTTVRQPLREMGGMALRTALRLAAGERLDSHHVELATELVVRHSTAPPAGLRR